MKDRPQPRPRLGAKSSLPKSFYRYGSVAERITRIFHSMDAETVEKVLQAYRAKYGDGAYAYARKTVRTWQSSDVRRAGKTITRLLEVVPMYVDTQARFELAQVVREDVLKRLRRRTINLTLGTEDPPWRVMEAVRKAVQTQVETELPKGFLEMATWLSAGDSALFEEIIRKGERKLLGGRMVDFVLQLRFVQDLRRELEFPARIVAVFEIPTAQIRVRVVHSSRVSTEHEGPEQDEHSLLARWNELELESRFKSGEVSYPEYVLRNMDQFFTKDQQAELHKIAAMHGLELERLLMEIQIKSRTTEADLKKLLDTLKTLNDKGINADVVSRHETPSGHIEISAKSRSRLLGCLPFCLGIAGFITLIVAR